MQKPVDAQALVELISARTGQSASEVLRAMAAAKAAPESAALLELAEFLATPTRRPLRGHASPGAYASSVEFSEVIKKRKMVRAYTADPVDPEVRDRILAAANRAPSAGFSQGYALLTLEGPDELRPFWQLLSEYHGDEAAAGPSFEPVTRAPLVVIPLSCKDIYLDRYARPDKGWTDRDEAHWPVPYWDIDTGFTALMMLLAAVDEGLGALFFGIPPHQIADFRALYRVPGQYVPIGAVAIGHPDPAADQGGSGGKIKRRALGDLVHRGRW